MQKASLYITYATSFFVAAASLAGCHEKQEVKQEDKKFVLSDTMAKMILMDTVRRARIDDALTLSGEISFNENSVVKIFPHSSGQVTETKVSLGDRVERGQVIAVIKSADVAGSYADLSGADADVAIAKRQLDNAESLYKSGISSEKDYTEAKQNYLKAEAAKQKIQSLLSINGGNSQPGGVYSVIAPISGYIVEKKVNAGSFIRPDMGDNLFTISDLKEVWVWANVFETDIPKVKEGAPVQVSTLAYPGKVFNGKIEKLSEVLDPTNKALRVRITLQNEGLLLKPEMFAKVQVSNIEKDSAICIPTKALVSQNGKDFVVVYNSPSDMQIAPVEIMKTLGDKTYLNSGVTPGQLLVVKNQLLLFEQLQND
ncbi:membrane fusion protein, cobalt-zinc-cadmium efflux system [Filimonas lacunae]|uniref:Membrane fusion protein, cobalt-zinc-cadmium efflux system n=1 Tax=Filimonas lacunae TaxID=477680 RepID=A0A173MJ69_9BACT|nr:efflux RND transporter periplasmic adaptor subunit [Filimonas lacunae]BAV07675.1 Co/Zn/Cd efflux system membrane fusion protein [Filimonas lacunae]SIT03377.1 membrane fusion protein, cobalt-zinc-cadmium efflux system [Filimonas lacunae]